MTDEEIMKAPELKAIKKHLQAAVRAVRALEERSGRELAIFVEAEAGPFLIDRDFERDNGKFSRFDPVTEGGWTVAHFSMGSEHWACGAA